MWRALLFVLFLGCSGQNNQDYIGSEYLGVSYTNDPLGEEVAPDTDPLIRFDVFDCTTFVETTLAGGNKQKLNKIRYRGGNVDFINRNHFIETDWLQNNSNLVKNVSKQYAPTKIRTVTIDKKNWFKKLYGIDTDFEKRTINLEYIPFEYTGHITTTEPLIVLFIAGPGRSVERFGTDLAVRHMGFLLPDGRLRHASRKSGRVVDTDFYEYINQIMENQNNLGIMLLEIQK